MLLLYIYTHTNLYTQTSALTKRKRKTRVVVILIPCSFFFVSLYYRSERNFNSRKKERKKQKFECKHVLCDWIGLKGMKQQIIQEKKERKSGASLIKSPILKQ